MARHSGTGHKRITVETGDLHPEEPGKLLDGYLAQEFFFPPNQTVSKLYMKTLQGRMEFDSQSMLFKKGSKISTNTYFNSFYEDYWSRYTSLDNIKLVIQFSGRLHIGVFRDTKSMGCNRIVRESVMSNEVGVICIKLPLFQGGQLGRIFMDITAAQDSEIYYLGLKTGIPPARSPRITFGICTYRQEEYLGETLNRLVRYSSDDNRIAKIIVVNQGEEFKDAQLRELIASHDVIECIHQQNLGGSGGFSRTMHQGLSIKDVDYHVLMDDDVHIDERIIKNLISFVAYLKQEVIVGGHMLDALNPIILSEAGAMMNSNAHISLLHSSVDLTERDSIKPFCEAREVDYNAWCFCAMPMKYIQYAGYPLPLFIRADDIEYCLRMKEIGIPTVSMPGIGVWHEPFYAKAGGWQTYYDFRNRFILASAYPERFRLETPSLMLLIMMKALAVHDYQKAALIHMAVEDFLKGPALFDEESSVKIHERVAALNKRFQPDAVDGNKKYREPKLRENPKKRFGRTLKILRRLLAVLLVGHRKKEANLLYIYRDVHVGNIGAHAYVKTNGIRSFHLQYNPDRESLKYLLKGCMSAYLRYCSHSRETAKKWNEELPRFRKTAWWGNVFGQK